MVSLGQNSIVLLDFHYCDNALWQGHLLCIYPPLVPDLSLTLEKNFLKSGYKILRYYLHFNHAPSHPQKVGAWMSSDRSERH